MESISASGYGSGLLGTLTVAGIAGIAYCVKTKMKHSSCDLDSGCLKVSAHEDDETRRTIREEILEQLRREGVIPKRGEGGPTLV